MLVDIAYSRTGEALTCERDELLKAMLKKKAAHLGQDMGPFSMIRELSLEKI